MGVMKFIDESTLYVRIHITYMTRVFTTFCHGCNVAIPCDSVQLIDQICKF